MQFIFWLISSIVIFIEESCWYLLLLVLLKFLKSSVLPFLFNLPHSSHLPSPIWSTCEKKTQAALEDYHNLLRAVICHESTKNVCCQNGTLQSLNEFFSFVKEGNLDTNWNGQMSDEAMSFLSVYSSVYCLTVLEQTAKLVNIWLFEQLT